MNSRGVGTGLMGSGAVLIVLGALLRFAVTVSTTGFNINVAGGILLLVGIGLVLVGVIAMVLGTRSTTTTQDSVQNTPGGQVRTTQRDERFSL